MKIVNEIGLNRLFNKHTENGYVMVSACRHDWSEDDEIENREINNIKTKELKEDIQKAGYQYIPVQGGFVEDDGTEVVEKSFLIVNFKNKSGKGEPAGNFSNLKKLAIGLCGKYNQDSVLVVEPGEKPTYYTRTGEVDGQFDSKTVRDAAQKYFTKIGGGRKFSFLESVEQPGTINGMRSRSMRGEICELAGHDRRLQQKGL